MKAKESSLPNYLNIFGGNRWIYIFLYSRCEIKHSPPRPGFELGLSIFISCSDICYAKNASMSAILYNEGFRFRFLFFPWKIQLCYTFKLWTENITVP